MLIEFIWLLLLAGFAASTAYPVYGVISSGLVHGNILIAFVFACYFRLAIFFRQVPWLSFLAVQIPLFLFNPIVFYKTVQRMQETFYLFDTNDLSFFMHPGSAVSVDAFSGAFHFFKNEFVLFSVGLLVALAAVELRLFLAFTERIRRMK